MDTLLLLDGNCLAARASFALPETILGPEGPINAVLGFSSMLLRLLADHKPRSIAVAFDPDSPSFRHQIFPSYKAGRVSLPPSFRHQLTSIKKVLTSLSVSHLAFPPFEADDLLATWASRARAREQATLIVTTDRDLMQLVEDPYISLIVPRRGVTDYDLYDEAKVLTQTGAPPARYVELAALRCDPSDNIPGVSGIGTKTAAKLLRQFGSCSQLFEHLGELTPYLRKALTTTKETIEMNLGLITLIRDVPAPELAPAFDPCSWNLTLIDEIFSQLGIGGLTQRLKNICGLYRSE